MNDLVIGEQTVAGKVVIVTVKPNGTFVAGFPMWKKLISVEGEKDYEEVEVSTLPLLTAVVWAMLPYHP